MLTCSNENIVYGEHHLSFYFAFASNAIDYQSNATNPTKKRSKLDCAMIELPLGGVVFPLVELVPLDGIWWHFSWIQSILSYKLTAALSIITVQFLIGIFSTAWKISLQPVLHTLIIWVALFMVVFIIGDVKFAKVKPPQLSTAFVSLNSSKAFVPFCWSQLGNCELVVSFAACRGIKVISRVMKVDFQIILVGVLSQNEQWLCKPDVTPCGRADQILSGIEETFIEIYFDFVNFDDFTSHWSWPVVLVHSDKLRLINLPKSTARRRRAYARKAHLVLY